MNNIQNPVSDLTMLSYRKTRILNRTNKIHRNPCQSRHIVCIRAKSAHRDDDNDNDDNPYEDDPVLKKFHFIDPGVLQYQRATFETLFHQVSEPLSGEELRLLAEGHRIKLVVEDKMVILLFYNTKWKDVDEKLWDNMATILTSWSAEKIVREAFPHILAEPSIFGDNEFIKIPLNIRHES